MGDVIYEAKSLLKIHPTNVLLGIIAVGFIIFLVINWKKGGLPFRCFFSFVPAFLLFLTICQVYTYFDSQQVYFKYKAGNYEIAEGTIEKYTVTEYPHQCDTFQVQGMDFLAPGYVTGWGYPFNRANGGVLEDGMRVRIYYVPYKFENVIMRLELLVQS
ncbi:MAG: hypothetical protein IJ333_07240 [Clostridia bacterium]|nr:hypothetical protein [Clostridia bacterium]